MIIDDRRMGVVRNHFLPILEDYGWTVTMAYITGVMNTREWQDLESLYATGRVDVQVHGFMHNGTTYFTEQTASEIIHQEIENAIPLIKQHLGYQPHAFIWPGGNFLSEAITVARQAGYQVAFTAYSRGPLLFNWIPLGEPEVAMHDPLMVLPRYWSTAAYINLDEAVRISDEARQFGEDHRQEEQDWYNSYCSGGPTLRPIPVPTEAPLEPGDIAP
jgi:peptidoglycan/xylan/chitin deacetylase (PgdA/CDA1 family)